MKCPECKGTGKATGDPKSACRRMVAGDITPSVKKAKMEAQP